MPSGGSITLVDVAKLTETLVVACSRCDRAGRYRVDTLIERHGPLFGVPMLLRLLSEDCPKRRSTAITEMCGVHCPELPALFNVPQG